MRSSIGYTTDSESETEDNQTMPAEGITAEDQTNVRDRLEANKEYMRSLIEDRKITCRSSANDIFLIQKPTASGLSHYLLNPYVYNDLQPIGSIEDLANELGAPGNWKPRCNELLQNQHVLRMLFRMQTLERTSSEAYVDTCFIQLVTAISIFLDLEVPGFGETKIVVGGILALHPYDFRGKTDTHFMDESERRNVLASEVKTDASFPDGHIWFLIINIQVP